MGERRSLLDVASPTIERRDHLAPLALGRVQLSDVEAQFDVVPETEDLLVQGKREAVDCQLEVPDLVSHVAEKPLNLCSFVRVEAPQVELLEQRLGSFGIAARQRFHRGRSIPVDA